MLSLAFRSILGVVLASAGNCADTGNTQFVVDYTGKTAVDVETGNTARFGLKPAEAAAFHANLGRLRDLLLAQPVFQPPRGIDVLGYIRADQDAPVIQTASVPGYGFATYYPYAMSAKLNRPVRMVASPWEIEMFLNAPGRGATIMNVNDPARQLRLLYEPRPGGRLHGFPVYRDADNNEFIVLSSTGKPSWIPVTREEYVRLWIRIVEKDKAADGGQALTLERLNRHQSALARMSPEERAAQARYGGTEGDPLGPSLMPYGSKEGIPLVKANPDCLDPSRPRSDLQLIVMKFNWRGDLDPDHPAPHESGNAVGLRLWETLHTSDWKAIGAVLPAR